MQVWDKAKLQQVFWIMFAENLCRCLSVNAVIIVLRLPVNVSIENVEMTKHMALKLLEFQEQIMIYNFFLKTDLN